MMSVRLRPTGSLMYASGEGLQRVGSCQSSMAAFDPKETFRKLKSGCSTKLNARLTGTHA